MSSDVVFPIYGFAKDDRSMWLVENPDRILYHMEPIDIENGEYLLWDANGQSVRISIKRNKVTGITHCDSEMPLPEAFQRYSEAYGLNVDTTGPADEVWQRLKEAEARLPRRPSIFSKLFRQSER
jgi:hypothetical protein